MPFVWSVGTIIGPAIGGTLADPAENFPDNFSRNGLFGRFPYLLPNLVCASLLVMSMTFGYFFLEESHPDMQPRLLLPPSTYTSDETPLMATTNAMKAPAVELRAETYGTFKSNGDSGWRNSDAKFGTPTIFTKQVISLIVALGIFTYHSMTYDHLLPIFLEDERRAGFSTSSQTVEFLSASGGLGLSVHNVGVIMSTNGLIALFVQAVIFPVAAEKLGTYRLFILVTLGHPMSYIIMPCLVYIPPSYLYPAIYFCFTVRNLLSILAYPLLLIMIKEASPSPSVLGKINGLSASAAAACRTVAPPVAGFLYGIGSKMDFTALAWYGSAFVAVIGAVQCFSIKRGKSRIFEEDCVEYKRELSRDFDKESPVVLITETGQKY